MPVYKDTKTETYRVVLRYKDETGKWRQTSKRGFATKSEALAWEREQLSKCNYKMDMTFASFTEQYLEDIRARLRVSSMIAKERIISIHILPYFGKMKMNDIMPRHILKWQNVMCKQKTVNGEPLSPTYLRQIQGQLSAIFNHAVKYYELQSNPCNKVDKIGKARGREMLCWTQEEYKKFLNSVNFSKMLVCAFEILFWCGLREGELLALTLEDIDLEKHTISINKTLMRIKSKDMIGPPKTDKGNRVVDLPEFLVNELQDYIQTLYTKEKTDRLFPVSAAYLRKRLACGADDAGVKRIRLHDFRHSHISMLIGMGVPVTAIADRVGHSSINITFNYAHMFPSQKEDVVNKLNMEKNFVIDDKKPL